MKKAKLKKVNDKSEKEIIKEEYSLKKLIIIVVILAITFGTFYFITLLVVDKSDNKNDNGNNTSVIDSTKITLSQLLDRRENEYYVLATKNSMYKNISSTSINYSNIYNDYIKRYKNNNENAITFYYVDLDDALNKNFIGEETTIGEDLSNLKLNNEVLFKIVDGKIESYSVGNQEIIDILSNL